MLIFDQVALQVMDMDAAVAAYKKAGHWEWVQDTVDAVHLYRAPGLSAGDAFKVRLAFNYTVMPSTPEHPGVEFELLQLLSGTTYQLQYAGQLLSHFGYHTKRDQGTVGEDSLLDELRRLKSLDFEVMQVSQTVSHTGTSRRYRYAYVHPKLGAPIKIIQRLLPLKRPEISLSLSQGRELFACL